MRHHNFREVRIMHRYSLTILGLFLTLLLASSASAQEANPTPGSNDDSGMCLFIDEDGDGFNDLAPDADGDGIPNGLDPDYVRPEDGEGQQHQWKWIDGLFAKVFGFSIEGEMNGNAFGAGESGGMSAGPGTGTGFGPSTASSGMTGSGESQAEQAGRRGGRR
jgi:hypothetical protein